MAQLPVLVAAIAHPTCVPYLKYCRDTPTRPLTGIAQPSRALVGKRQIESQRSLASIASAPILRTNADLRQQRVVPTPDALLSAARVCRFVDCALAEGNHSPSHKGMKSVKELLKLKRDGGLWTTEEIQFFIDGVVSGNITSAQAAAFLMAACIHGLSNAETAALTTSMTNSGVVLRYANTQRKRIDKHSTGGVGDKVSLLVAPLAAACGLDVPMISGRGLGHTGGTVDKLESIIGFKTVIPVEEQLALIDKYHVMMIGQSEDVAPADRILYALRDATGTVENTGLITASILSKKLAEGIDGLVLDVKVGSAAFMKDIQQAEVLARSMQEVGAAAGLPITVVFSKMDTILGRAAGNWVEVVESYQALQKRAHAPPDLVEITTELVARMLMIADASITHEAARQTVLHAWDSGEGHRMFMSIIENQGGDWQASFDHYNNNTVTSEVFAASDGFLLPLDGMSVANALQRAGGGRMRESDNVDHTVGVTLTVDPGERVQAGDVIAMVTARNDEACKELVKEIEALVNTTTAPRNEEPSIIIQVWN